MARTPKYPFLKDFEEWVRDDRMISQASAHTYARCVSSLLNKLGEDLSEESVKAVLLDYEDSSSFPTYKTSWSAFAEWTSLSGLSVPTPDFKKHRRSKIIDLPKEALDLLVFMSSLGIPMSQAARLKWGHISPQSDSLGYDVALPNKPGEYYKVAEPTLRAWLASWPSSREEITGHEFVFTHGSDSEDPYPLKALRDQVKEHMKQMDSEEALPFVRDGSALGSALPDPQPKALAPSRGSAIQTEDMPEEQASGSWKQDPAVIDPAKDLRDIMAFDPEDDSRPFIGDPNDPIQKTDEPEEDEEKDSSYFEKTKAYIDQLHSSPGVSKEPSPDEKFKTTQEVLALLETPGGQ